MISKGIVFTEGKVWKEHRKFTKSVLRDFGMGKVNAYIYIYIYIYIYTIYSYISF